MIRRLEEAGEVIIVKSGKDESLPSRNIVKDAEERDVQSYDFFAGFLLKKEEEEIPEEERILEEPEAEEIEYETLKEEILEEAREQARHIVQEARQQAELLSEEAFEEGKKAGEQEGIRSHMKNIGRC